MYVLLLHIAGKVRVRRVAWCYGCQGIGLWRGPAPDVSKIAVYVCTYLIDVFMIQVG
jgi:hypothetical protein